MSHWGKSSRIGKAQLRLRSIGWKDSPDHLWMAEYHDRFIRDLDHLHNAKAYIRNNPVKARLCGKPEEWVVFECGPELERGIYSARRFRFARNKFRAPGLGLLSSAATCTSAARTARMACPLFPSKASARRCISASPTSITGTSSRASSIQPPDSSTEICWNPTSTSRRARSWCSARRPPRGSIGRGPARRR